MRIKRRGKLIINLVAALALVALADAALAQNEAPPPESNPPNATAPEAVTSQDSARLQTLLNRASQINQEEERMAGIAKDKAGNNQALITFADTLKADHQANQDAVKALADQNKIKLNQTESNAVSNVQNQLNNLSGAHFNSAFLDHEIRDHRQALNHFRDAQKEFRGDRDVETYIGQTVPVLEAHLRMAENLQRQAAAGSPENPANNEASGNNDQ